MYVIAEWAIQNPIFHPSRETMHCSLSNKAYKLHFDFHVSLLFTMPGVLMCRENLPFWSFPDSVTEPFSLEHPSETCFLKPFLYYTNFAIFAKNITRLRAFLLLSVMLPGGRLFLIAKVKTPWKWTIQAEEIFTWAWQVFQSPYLSILFSNTGTIWWRL